MQQIAATDSTVLITGETGTGKELAAQLIHDSSRRAPHPFVSINCAAIPEGLLESELFGFERGAFTGAAASSSGRLTAAHRGTLLLDEIGDMTPATQAKVLQLVEEKTVNRLGTTRTTRLDARVLAATHQDLPVLMDDGRFRPDLYFRLNVARLHLPPLRERAADIPELLSHYLPVACEGLQRDVEAFSDEAVDLLTRYEWPGNIRELKNVVERLVIHASSRTITAGDLEEVVNPITLRPVARETKQATLLSALVSAGGNKTEAARALGCSRMTVYRRLAEYTAARKMGR
jgi:transcriptional regulator with PAS, ATPase and Fis domain